MESIKKRNRKEVCAELVDSIAEYLPENYSNAVIEKLKWDKSKVIISLIQRVKAKRCANLEVAKAIHEVGKAEKEKLEKAQELLQESV
jgi:hypothetical protein